MSEFKGTKGGWFVHNEGHEIRKDDGNVLAVLYHTNDVNKQESPYNAQLISCAPEMVEALKVGRQAIMELMSHEEGWEDEYTYIDNLITKATTI